MFFIRGYSQINPRGIFGEKEEPMFGLPPLRKLSRVDPSEQNLMLSL